MNQTQPSGARLAKVMARAGLCSRREAETWIRAGRVAVNGAPVLTPAHTVNDADAVTVDGTPLPQAERTRLWLYHKPPGVLTTTRDAWNRPILFDRLPPELPRVVAVGRLDMTSEGLLLLTNDGALARRLELPATGHRRHYRARVFGAVTQAALDGLKDGVTVDGVAYGPVTARLETSAKPGASSEPKSNVWVSVTLREGRNREVRRIMEHLGCRVNRLIRVGYGPLRLGDLPRGAAREAPAAMVRQLCGEKKYRAGWATAHIPARRGADKRSSKSGR